MQGAGCSRSRALPRDVASAARAGTRRARKIACGSVRLSRGDGGGGACCRRGAAACASFEHRTGAATATPAPGHVSDHTRLHWRTVAVRKTMSLRHERAACLRPQALRPRAPTSSRAVGQLRVL